MIRVCLALALVLGACSDDDDSGGGESAPTTATSGPSTSTPGTTTTGGTAAVPVLDWDALPEPAVTVEGWQVGHCDGDDRLATCPAGTTVEPDDEVALLVGGQPGRRIGFRVRLGDGTLVEHGVSWVREEGDGLRLVGATGLHLDRACLEPIGEFAIDDLEAVTGLLDRSVAASEI